MVIVHICLSDCIDDFSLLDNASVDQKLAQLTMADSAAAPATPSSANSSPTPRGRLTRGRSRLRSSQSLGKSKMPLLFVEEGSLILTFLVIVDLTFATDDRGGAEDSAVYEMQDKLVAVWDALQINTHTRINFMRKYSSEAYSIEMARAVDLWAETAVYALILVEVTRCLKKLQVRTC